MLTLILNLVQGGIALGVVAIWTAEGPVWASFTLLSLNVVLSVIVTKLGWGEGNPKGTVREVVELVVQLITVLVGTIYLAYNTGGNIAVLQTPLWVALIATLVVLVNIGPLVAALLRGIAWVLELVGGYTYQDVIGPMGG